MKRAITIYLEPEIDDIIKNLAEINFRPKTKQIEMIIVKKLLEDNRLDETKYGQTL